MNKIQKFLDKLPGLLSSRVSIFIYLFLFFYLVVFALLTLIVPALANLSPSSNVQLILGNYTNVLSALGASIAAGSGVAIHHSVKRLHEKHDLLVKSLNELHEKVDQLNRKD